MCIRDSCCSLETRTQVRGRVPPVGRKLFCRIWSAVSSLHSESEPLPGARSKPPHLFTAYSDQFRRFPPGLETIWPVLSENLLGISTHSSQDIIFYGPLLL